jgi:hypothetical protein
MSTENGILKRYTFTEEAINEASQAAKKTICQRCKVSSLKEMTLRHGPVGRRRQWHRSPE